MQQIAQELNYKRTLVVKPLIISATENLSDVFDCGGMQPRAIFIPFNFTPTVLRILCSIDPEFSLGLPPLLNFDGSPFSPTPEFGWLPLPPWQADAFPYFVVESLNAQTNEIKMNIILQPLYQGVHG